MFIVIEGIDRVGKTTLCNKLKEELGLNVLKFDIPKAEESLKDTIYGYIKMLIDLANRDALKETYVIDRFNWTEIVYGCIERGYINKNVMDLEQEMKKHFLMILVKPTDVVMSSKNHGKDLSLHNILFNVIFEFSTLKKFSCDYNTLENAVNFVKEQLEVLK